MTWIPFWYCWFVGASPTDAKWPFIVITEGAVGYRDATEGRLGSLSLAEELLLMEEDDIMKPDNIPLGRGAD